MAAKTQQDLYEREMARYRRVLESDPQLALETYGMTLVNSLDPAERTLALQAFGHGEATAVDYYNLGVREAQRENYSRAIEHFRQAIEADTDLVDAIHNMAVCYEKTGFNDAAKSTWKVYLDIIGEGDLAARIRAHMDSL